MAAKIGATKGFAGFGNDIIVNEGNYDKYNRYLWVHETSHFWQYEAYGYGNTAGSLMWDQMKTIRGFNPYGDARSYEWQADQITGSFGISIY